MHLCFAFAPNLSLQELNIKSGTWTDRPTDYGYDFWYKVRGIKHTTCTGLVKLPNRPPVFLGLPGVTSPACHGVHAAAAVGDALSPFFQPSRVGRTCHITGRCCAHTAVVVHTDCCCIAAAL